MGASFAAELLKLYKRPAVWVIVAIWLVFVVLLAYALPYALFANLPQPEPAEDIPAEMQSEMQAQSDVASEQLISQLYPEALVSYVLSNISSTGGTLALILGALVVGSEYGWGTLKTVLSQRPGRLTTFFAKMLALGAALVLFVLLAFVVGAICSLIVTGIQSATVDWPSLVELLEGLGAGAVILATLFRSTALAIGLGLFYALALEGLVFGLPIQNESFQDARRFFLGQNSGFLADSFAGSSVQQPFVPPSPDIGAAQSALVLCLYLAAFILIAALAFRQRDVA